MADTIRCACDALNSAAGHLATLRLSEIRQGLDFLGVQHTEVLLGLVVFVLMQFTKFAAILLLAICLAYGIFYLWDTFFPGIAEFGHRSMKIYRNVRTSANLPPFALSDGDESSGPEGYSLSPTVARTPNNTMTGSMLIPLVQNSKVLQSIGLQAGKIQYEWDEKTARGSRGHTHGQEPGKHRREQNYLTSMSPEREREWEREPHSSRRTGPGTSHDAKRTTNVLRIPKVTSGGVDFRRVHQITSDDLKRLPIVTSGESRRTPTKEEARRLQNVTSGEMGGSRRVPKLTSHTNGSPRWLNVAKGEVRESRRKERSSHPREASASRRPSNGHGASVGGGGAGESKSRRTSERQYPAEGRRPEEQPLKKQRISDGSNDTRPKQRRSNNNSRSGVFRRPYPDEHIDRLKRENQDYQARRLTASGGAGHRHSGNHPTSEGAMLTRQDNFVTSFRRSDRRESQRSPKSSNTGREGTNRNRHDPKKDPKI